jgi:transposase
MSRKKTSLKRIRKLLESHLDGVTSSRELGARAGLSHTKVQSFQRLLTTSGYSFQELLALDDEALSAIVYPKEPEPVYSKPLPDFERIHKALSTRRKTGLTRTLFWQEYREEHPDGYSLTQFNEHYCRWVKQQKNSSMPQERIPGERLYPDYSGLKMFFINRDTGEKHICELYVSSLGVSGKIYSEASLTQQIPDWIRVTENAFHYYGGVTPLINPDNLKSAVTTPSRYDPEHNRIFEEICDHYGTAIFVARIVRPKDKALAESAVQNVQRWVVAPLRNRIFFSLAELNEAIWEKLEILNNRLFSAREGSRNSQFKEIDLPELKPLPLQRFEYAEWVKATVHPDYHVQYKYCYYSVHHSHQGKKVDLRATADGIEIFIKSKRIASHMRLNGKGKRSTLEEHMPPAHLAYKMIDRDVRKWLESREGATLDLARKIYSREKHAALSLRRIQGLMSLEKKYDEEVFEKACQFILITETSYRHATLNYILEHKLYTRRQLTLDLNEADQTAVEHKNIRGGVYYT